MRSHVPVYIQVARGLREMISAGELAPGHVFPGEFQMAREYGVGREAVRKALGVLRQEGLIATKRGEASYVRAAPEPRRIAIGPDVEVRFRQTTPEERIDLGIDEGVGLVVIQKRGHEPELLPSDEVIITGEKSPRGK